MESYLELSKKFLTPNSDVLDDIEENHIKNNIDLLLKLEKLTKDQSKESRLTNFINTGEYKEIFERISNLSCLKFEINKSNEAEKYIVNLKKEYEKINKYVINWNEYSFLSYLKKLFKR